MPLYIVEVITRSGEWEYSGKHAVTATSPEEAELLALQEECYNPEEDLHWADGGVYDLDGKFFLRVRSTVKVDSAHEAVIKQYL